MNINTPEQRKSITIAFVEVNRAIARIKQLKLIISSHFSETATVRDRKRIASSFDTTMNYEVGKLKSSLSELKLLGVIFTEDSIGFPISD